MEQPFYFPDLKKYESTFLYQAEGSKSALPREIQMWLLLLIGAGSCKSLKEPESKGVYVLY